MSLKRTLLLSLAVCATLALPLRLLAWSAAAQTAPDDDPAAATPTEGDFAAIDTYLEQQMARLNIPGISLAIVQDDQIVHARGFGEARPGGETPTPQTPFVLGSITKSFTALAVMQLVERGQIDLDAPVQTYLPWFSLADPAAAAQITVRHLLNQTSGLPQLPGLQFTTDFDPSPDALERQARTLATLELGRAVGAEFEYSNLNYNLLGLVVEAASGETYADYVQTHIFDPLEMRHSYTAQAPARRDNLAMGYRFWFGLPVAAPELPLPRGSLPSGQLVASAEDMAHYLIAQLNGGRYGDAQVISPEGIATLHQPAVEAHEMHIIPMGHYGMGWFIDTEGATPIVWHNGTTPDFYTYMALLPERNQGLIMLVNANQMMMNTSLMEVGDGLTALLAGDAPAPPEMGFMPWLLRALLAVPILQVVGVAFTLRRVRRWQQEPDSRPQGGRLWGLHVGLPLLGNGLLAAPLIALLGTGTLGLLKLFMADFAWWAILSGGFAAVWGLLRTGLILNAARAPRPSTARAASHPAADLT